MPTAHARPAVGRIRLFARVEAAFDIRGNFANSARSGTRRILSRKFCEFCAQRDAQNFITVSQAKKLSLNFYCLSLFTCSVTDSKGVSDEGAPGVAGAV